VKTKLVGSNKIEKVRDRERFRLAGVKETEKEKS
jgi:hypothetical protein